MVGTPSTTVTVDRISNSGNAIAEQQASKAIHVPVKDVGTTLEVKLVDQGSHFEARVVNRAIEAHARPPSATPDTSDLLDSDSDSHSYSIHDAPAGGSLRTSTVDESGEELRSQMPRRKK